MTNQLCRKTTGGGVILKCKQTNLGTSDGLEQVNGLNSAADERWSNIHLNDQTGELTIRNIQMKQSGVYKVEIKTIRLILHRKFEITVDGVKNISVKKGESVTLRTGVIDIQRYDWILWKFEDHLIAEINKETNQFILYDSSDKRFKDRLQPNEKTGSLTISDSETTDSGHYHLHMSSSTYTLQRIISVTVKGLSSIVIAVISVTVALVVAVALMIYCWCRSRQRSDRVV
uniref:Si:dkey-182g1.6 n=1 Tax=Cyprinus carpio carpio TaxID=630221 RepID=A0A9J8CSL7_CYPCA